MKDDLYIDTESTIEGPWGKVEWVPVADSTGLPARQQAALRHHVCTYLITAPHYHPAWSQYAMSVIRLVDDPALPAPVLKFEGATHELLVMAINPEPGPMTVERMQEHGRQGDLPFLQPINIAEQFIADDDEIRAVAWLCGRSITLGAMTPETSDAPSLVRLGWLAACTKTLAHLRGEEHA